MPHIYDTALPKAQRTLIREAVITRLSALKVSAGLYVRAIKSLPRPIRGEGDDEGLAMLVDTLAGQAPAILVALGRKSYDPAGIIIPADQYRGEIELAVYVASVNVRSHDARLAGDAASAADMAADPGIETMLEHCEELLVGYEFPLTTVYEIRPESESDVFTGGDFTIWGQTYSLKVQRDIATHPPIVGTLLEIEGTTSLDGTPDNTDVATTLATILEEP